MVDLIFVALLQAVSGDPAAPAENATQVAEAPAATQTEDEGIRCERRTIVGTRLSERVCTTAAQRREMEEYARSQINRGQSQLGVSPPVNRPSTMGN
jgi:hypothetical protein